MGKNTVTQAAKSWAGDLWKITYGNIGPLFLPKAAALTKPGGQVAMMQPLLALIFNQVGTAQEFRSKLFSTFKVDEIVNLSTLRFGLFKDAISPACIITISVTPPDNQPLTYICPKPTFNNEDDYHIVFELQDINTIYLYEAINDPLVWTALMWGSRRDLSLMRRLSKQKNITQLENEQIAITSQGIIRGSNKKKCDLLLERRFIESKYFPLDTFIYVKKEDFPINQDPYAERSRIKKIDTFKLPQLIIKQSWLTSSKRFQATLTELDNTQEGIICSENYVSIHMPEQRISQLNAACLTYNSKLAVYYLLLANGSFASYIPKVSVKDLLRVPIPEKFTEFLPDIKNIDDVDEIVRQAFDLKDSEWVLINDLFNYTLPDFKGDISSPGRQKTHRGNSELELRAYCEYFLRVIKAGFGQDKQICATIFQEQNNNHLPIRLVAIYLNRLDCEGVNIESIDYSNLLEKLESLNQLYLEKVHVEDGGILYQRVAKIYDSVQLNGLRVPTIYLIKPDKIRYWTRSVALRDADELAADMMMWQTTFDTESEVMQGSYSG